LGTNFHQTTITNIRWGVNGAAQLRRAPDQPAPWEALSQTALLGCMRPDGSPYRTYPDVFVYPHAIDPHRGSTTVDVDGPPVLTVEVLSDSTYEVDLDLVHGKGYSYAHAGVREYLTIDPTGTFLPEGIRAWRLEEGIYRPWEPETDGRWHSAALPISLGLEGTLAAVYTADGRRMLREDEAEVELERLRRLLHEREGID
jgi:Uma2 family endonuclease